MYLCDYKPEGHSIFHSVLFAENEQQAAEFIKQRGIWETKLREVYPNDRYPTIPVLPSEYIMKWDWAEAIHAACWMMNLVVNSDPSFKKSAVHDLSLIHRLAHLSIDEDLRERRFQPVHAYEIQHLYFMAKDFEERIPGFKPLVGDYKIYHKDPKSVLYPAFSPRELLPTLTCVELRDLMDSGRCNAIYYNQHKADSNQDRVSVTGTLTTTFVDEKALEMALNA